MVAVRKDYAAPTGLDFILACDSTNMPRRWRWGGRARHSVRAGLGRRPPSQPPRPGSPQRRAEDCPPYLAKADDNTKLKNKFAVTAG